jgi:uncharacterized protein (UPF0147 family)
LGALSKELAVIARNIRVFIGKNKATKQILRNMGLRLSDVSDEARGSVKEAARVLTDESLDEKERISRAEDILSKLRKDERLPLKIREMIIATALERLAAARASLESPRYTVVAGVVKFHPTIDLLISRDEETLKHLKKFGISEVPDFVREAALKAKGILDDESLGEKERAMRAADVLSELLQPAYLRGRDIPGLQHELKLLLWEIAYSLSKFEKSQP